MEVKTKRILLWLLVNICRFFVAAVFIFSAIVKIVDPRGTEYKIQDYGEAFGMSRLLPSYVPLVMAVVLALVEFRIGISTLFGIQRRATSRFTLAFMLLVTPLTLYIALAEPVSDCGCFGDAWLLTGWQTFGKNVLLLVATLLLVIYYRMQTRLISERSQWLVSLYALLYGTLLAGYCIFRLPVIDFRPYHVGADLVEAMKPEGEVTLETKFLMEKNGERKLFPLEDYPDSTWTFIDTETVQTGEARPAKIDNLQIVTWPEKEDITQDILTRPGYKFFLVSPYLEWADDGYMDSYEQIYSYAQRHEYPFYCLTSSSGEAINRWADLTGAEYPFCRTDAITLKTMVRSNPGLILMKGSVVVGKWPCSDIPELNEDSPTLEKLPIGIPQLHSHMQRVLQLVLWFVVPLAVFTFLDRLWFGQRMFRAHRKRKKRKRLLLNQEQNSVKPKNKTTMRKKIVAGNWKMNLNLQEGVALANELKEALAAEKPNCDVIICTPFIHLATVAGITEGTVIGLGAENCADKEKGAYTGEVSAAQVKSTGAQYVILGHSERRAYYGETAEILKEKVNLALANGLKVIFCIGEVLEEREANKQNEVVGAQLADSLFDLTEEQLSNIILAYEPVWAIGTGKTATAEQAQDMHAFIRGVIAGRFGEKAAEEISILYGGSCKPSNAKEIFSKPDVDGGLIGGAALKCADFKGIIDAWN